MSKPDIVKGLSVRAIAVKVLERIERDAAYAAAALDAELDRHPQLEGRDRALLSELVYGVSRTKKAIEARLTAHTPRGISDRLVRLHLTVAAYQMLLLDRIPVWAAVDEAIGDIRRARGPRVAGFGNAVLRKLAEEPKVTLADAVRESAPAWLFAALEASVGAREAEALLGAGVPLGRVWGRLVLGATAPDWLAQAEPHRSAPLARQLPGGDPDKLAGFAEGAFVVQEPGAQLVALSLGARPGERVLDACAGRGQKTTLLCEMVAPSGSVFAADSHPKKLAILAAELERVHLPAVTTAAVDWTLGTGDVPDGFERVLVDAPCTGTGTLRRRPEIVARLTPEDPARLRDLQVAILRSAATRAKVGGRVVYAVCSVLREEAEDVVSRVADLLEPTPFDADFTARVGEPGATALRLTPLRDDTDGYFLACFVRR